MVHIAFEFEKLHQQLELEGMRSKKIKLLQLLCLRLPLGGLGF